MLPGAEEEALELAPEEAAEELLARMLEYRRYRDAAADLGELFAAGRGYLHRSAPLPPDLRRVAVDAARPAYEPDLLAAAIGDLLRVPPKARHQPHPADGLARDSASTCCASSCSAAASSTSTRASATRTADPGRDPVRAARAPQAAARRPGSRAGSSSRSGSPRSEPVRLARRAGGRAMSGALEQTVEALLFLSPEPVAIARAGRGLRGDRGRDRSRARPARAGSLEAAAGSSCDEVARRLHPRHRSRRRGRRPRACWRSRRRRR